MLSRHVDSVGEMCVKRSPARIPARLALRARAGGRLPRHGHHPPRHRRHPLRSRLGWGGRCGTGGRSSTGSQFEPVMARIAIKRSGPGRPRTRPDRVAGDKGYSSARSAPTCENAASPAPSPNAPTRSRDADDAAKHSAASTAPPTPRRARLTCPLWAWVGSGSYECYTPLGPGQACGRDRGCDHRSR